MGRVTGLGLAGALALVVVAACGSNGGVDVGHSPMTSGAGGGAGGGAAGCSDMAKDGAESDVDCGGGCATKCGDGKACASTADCQSGVCKDGKCQAATCMDGVKNGGEGDVDCGGTCPTKCGDGKTCGGDADCLNGVCKDGKCQAATCMDGKKNDGEGDVDCGGTCAKKCGNGSTCKVAGDCTSGLCDVTMHCAVCKALGDCPMGSSCVAGACVPPDKSCATVKAGAAAAVDGEYLIDPDGPGGLAPFVVYCDMTTAGGGWTALPLKFSDTGLWDLPTTFVCTAITAKDAAGHFGWFQSSSLQSGNDRVSLKFKPPITVKEVRFEKLTHRTGGACNTMDFNIDAPDPAPYESWFFSAGDPTKSVGFVFGPCNATGYAQLAQTNLCEIGTGPDVNPGNKMYDLTRTVTLTAPAPQFHMVLVESCTSTLCNPNTDGEGIDINTPAEPDGVWKHGILIR